jgi:hypothetical protein
METETCTDTLETGANRLAFVTAASGELSRQWPAPGDPCPEGSRHDGPPAPRPRTELPARPAVPVARGGSADLLRACRPRSRSAARARTGPVARRLIVGALFLAAVTTFTMLAVAAFLSPPHAAGPPSSPSAQTERTPLSREPHGRLSAGSSASNGRTQDSRQTPPEAVP